MKSTLLVRAALVALVGACGTVRDRADCQTSANCPLGEYCAHTREGSVCWPDAVPPTVSGVTVVCGTGTAACPRDGTLEVAATATDDQELYAVEATLDLAPGRSFPLAPGSGGKWTGTIDLKGIPFPAFESKATVTVRVLDGARNEAFAVAEETQRPMVTRVRWKYESTAQLTPPAVTSDGTVVFGRSDTLNQLVAVNPDGTKAWSRTLGTGTGTVTAPPSIGAQAIWVGANDGKLYAVALDGSAEIKSRTCAANGVAKGPPAVLTTDQVDVAFGAFANGRIYASGPTCVPTVAGDPYSTGVAIGDGAVYAGSSSATVKALHRVTWDGEAFGAGWAVDVADTVNAPLVLSAASSVLTASVSGELERTTVGASSGSVSRVSALAQSIDDSPIVLDGGDIVVGDASGKLHRLASDGTQRWEVDLGSPVRAPMALIGGPVRFLVATDNGRVHALDGDGVVLWFGALTASGIALGAGNIFTPAGSDFSTAYFAGADGVLYAVVVEGWLDTTAAWPKAWHDARNTSRAGGIF